MECVLQLPATVGNEGAQGGGGVTCKKCGVGSGWGATWLRDAACRARGIGGLQGQECIDVKLQLTTLAVH
jgi:hypothetical protein